MVDFRKTDFFAESLREDTGVICDLLTLNDSEDDGGVSNPSVNIVRDIETEITRTISSQELDCDVTLIKIMHALLRMIGTRGNLSVLTSSI